MLLDEPGDMLDVRRSVTQTSRHLSGDRRTVLGVLAAPGLADRVEQDGQEERPPARRLGGIALGQAEVEPGAAAEELSQPVDGPDRVNVDRIDVIDVVVNTPEERLELGDHGDEQAHLVELGQDGPTAGDLARVLEQVEEDLRRLLGATGLLAPVWFDRDPGDGVARERVRPRPLAGDLPVEPERERRIVVQPVGVGHRHLAVEEHRSVAEVPPAGRAAQARRPGAGQHALGRLRDAARVPVIGLHELLDAERDPVDETQLVGQILLVSEGEPVLLPPRAEVEQVPDPPEHLAGRLELLHLAGQQRAGADVILRRASGPARPGRPLRDVEVSEAAAPLLHVGL